MNYYCKEDYQMAKEQRKRTLVFYLITLGAFLIVTAGMMVWFSTLPYESPTMTTLRLIYYPLIAVFVIYSYMFLGIKYKRINKYYHLTLNLETGIRETTVASFFEYDETIQEKDGVDFKSLIFLEWNKYKKDFFERKVLVFYEREFPEFKQNDNVKFVTQGNVLISYEILDNQEEL